MSCDYVGNSQVRKGPTFQTPLIVLHVVLTARTPLILVLLHPIVYELRSVLFDHPLTQVGHRLSLTKWPLAIIQDIRKSWLRIPLLGLRAGFVPLTDLRLTSCRFISTLLTLHH